MKTPEKAKERIWIISESVGLSDIVIGYGVDRIWELIKNESEDDVFTDMDTICTDVLTELYEL